MKRLDRLLRWITRFSLAKTVAIFSSFSIPIRRPVTTSRTRSAAGRPWPLASPMASPSMLPVEAWKS